MHDLHSITKRIFNPTCTKDYYLCFALRVLAGISFLIASANTLSSLYLWDSGNAWYHSYACLACAAMFLFPLFNQFGFRAEVNVYLCMFAVLLTMSAHHIFTAANPSDLELIIAVSIGPLVWTIISILAVVVAEDIPSLNNMSCCVTVVVAAFHVHLVWRARHLRLWLVPAELMHGSFLSALWLGAYALRCYLYARDQDDKALLSSSFEATFRLELSTGIISDGNVALDEIFQCPMRKKSLGTFLMKCETADDERDNVAAFHDFLARIKDSESDRDSSVHRCLLTFWSSDGNSFDCELRAVKRWRRVHGDSLLGLRMVGEQRPPTVASSSFDVSPPLSCRSSCPGTGEIEHDNCLGYAVFEEDSIVSYCSHEWNKIFRGDITGEVIVDLIFPPDVHKFQDCLDRARSPGEKRCPVLPLRCARPADNTLFSCVMVVGASQLSIHPPVENLGRARDVLQRYLRNAWHGPEAKASHEAEVEEAVDSF